MVSFPHTKKLLTTPHSSSNQYYTDALLAKTTTPTPAITIITPATHSSQLPLQPTQLTETSQLKGGKEKKMTSNNAFIKKERRGKPILSIF